MKQTADPQSNSGIDRATQLTRRTFVGGVLATGGAAAWRFLLHPLWVGGPLSPADFDQLLIGTVATLEIPLEMGKSFLATRPEVTPAGLLRELKESLVEGPPWPSTQAELRSKFAYLVRADLREGRLIRIHSGQLAITECRLAGLRYLLGSPVDQSSAGSGKMSFRILAQVMNWGPQSTQSPIAFNRQPDGSSALWFKSSGVSKELTVVLGEQELETRIHPDLLTARLSQEQASLLLPVATTYSVMFVARASSAAQLVGYFHNFPGGPGKAFSPVPMDLNGFSTTSSWPIEDWGPTGSAVGLAFNQQSDGKSAFWVRASKELPRGLFLILGGIPLPSLSQGSLITAAVVPALVRRFVSRPGKHRLQLVDPASRRVQTVGDFEVG